MYFLTGGRQLESDLYRVYYDGKADAAALASTSAPAGNASINDASKLRRSLERYHGQPRKGAIAAAAANLKHENRFIRHAARIAVEHQP